MNWFHIFLLVVILVEVVICTINLYRWGRYKWTSKEKYFTVFHYNIAAFFMIIGQSVLFLLENGKRVDHTFVYLNECQLKTHSDKREKCSPFWRIHNVTPGIDEGIISANDLVIYQGVVMTLIYTFTIAHCLYAAHRDTYDHSIKWIEYIFSSSLQTMIIYSLFGQVAQTIWVAMGLKAFAMMTAYGIEFILIHENGIFNGHEKKRDVLSKVILNNPFLFLAGSFLIYFVVIYVPLFVRNYSTPKNVEGSSLHTWAVFLFVAVAICEALFPFLLWKNRENLESVVADVDFCLLSMISKISFNSILVVGLMEREIHRDLGVGALILCIGVFGGIVYWCINPQPIYKTQKATSKYSDYNYEMRSIKDFISLFQKK